MIIAASRGMDWNLLVQLAIPVSLLIMAWGIRDALRFPQSQWDLIDRSRSAWIIMQLVFGPPAVFLYAAAIRFDLQDPDRLAYVAD